MISDFINASLPLKCYRDRGLFKKSKKKILNNEIKHL